MLAAGLVWLSLPLDLQPGSAFVLGVVLVTATAIIALSVYAQWVRREFGVEGRIEPVAYAELPVVLVIGPYAAAAFAHDGRTVALRRDTQAIWLPVRSAGELGGVLRSVRELHGRFPDAAMMPVFPDAHPDEATLRQEFTQWRHALGQTVEGRACIVPCYVAVYASLGGRATQPEQTRWFGDFVDPNQSSADNRTIARCVQEIRQQLERIAFVQPQRGNIVCAELGQALLDWFADSALMSSVASLANTAPFNACGFLLASVDGRASQQGAWTRWLTAKTGLMLPGVTRASRWLPLPDVKQMHAALPRASEVLSQPPLPMTVGYVAQNLIASMAVVLAISFAVSGWKNIQLIAQYADIKEAYELIPPVEIGARRDQVRLMQRLYAEVDQYEHYGVPTALGWGLYRGERLRPALLQTMANAPSLSEGVTLDSLALFDSGKASLKAGAARQLQHVLRLIRAHPGKRILIAGHADDSGSSAANLTLSESRARSIRDWLVANANVSFTEFAIIGYGDTRPVASNADEAGRALNRRVEITVLPDLTSR